jgi:hypothetical protein
VVSLCVVCPYFLCSFVCCAILCDVCYLCVVSYCSTTATGQKPICSYNNNNNAREVLSETGFSTWSVPRDGKEDKCDNQVSSVRESEQKSQRWLIKDADGREPPFRDDLSPEAEE